MNNDFSSASGLIESRILCHDRNIRYHGLQAAREPTWPISMTGTPFILLGKVGCLFEECRGIVSLALVFGHVGCWVSWRFPL